MADQHVKMSTATHGNSRNVEKGKKNLVPCQDGQFLGSVLSSSQHFVGLFLLMTRTGTMPGPRKKRIVQDPTLFRILGRAMLDLGQSSLLSLPWQRSLQCCPRGQFWSSKLAAS